MSRDPKEGRELAMRIVTVVREWKGHQAEGTASAITQRWQRNFGHSKSGKGQGDWGGEVSKNDV